MTAKRWSVSLVVLGALLVGCDDKKPKEPKVDNTPKAATTNMDDVRKAAAEKAAAADAAARSATNAAKTAATDAADATKTAAADATQKATDAAAAVKTQATDWMAKLETAIKDNKLDEAKTYLDKLESVRASLPVDWQTKLDSLKSAFNAAKLKAGAALPNLNK
jgi:hypothetical protein